MSTETTTLKEKRTEATEAAMLPGVQSHLAKFQPQTPEAAKPSEIKEEVKSENQDVVEDLPQEPVAKNPYVIERHKGKPAFTKRMIIEKREAEELREKAEKELESTRSQLNELQTKLAEYEKKRSEATTDGQFDKATQQADEIRREMAEMEERYRKEIEDRDAKIAYYDFEQHPQFKKKYVAPIQEAFTATRDYIGADENAQQVFMRALSANDAAIQSMDTASRLRAEQTRDELVSSLIEGLPPFKASRLTAYFNDLFDKTSRYAAAKKNFAIERENIEREAAEEARQAGLKQDRYWEHIYNQTGEEVSARVKLTPDFEKIAKDHNIDFDNSEDARIARAALQHGAKISERDITRVLNQGKEFKRMEALASVLLIRNKELEDTLSKYRSSDPGEIGGSEGSGISSVTKRVSPEEGLANHFAKFQSRLARNF